MNLNEELLKDYDKLYTLFNTSTDKTEKINLLYQLLNLKDLLNTYYPSDDVSLKIPKYFEKYYNKKLSKIEDKFEDMLCDNNDKLKIQSYSILNYACNLIPSDDYQYDNCFSKKDAYDIIMDFFNHFDHNLVKDVNDILKSNQIIYVNKTDDDIYNLKDGNASSIKKINKTYIEIYSCNDKLSISNISTLIHELGHAINFKLTNSNNIIYLLTSNNHEIPSITFEKLFLDYAKSKNIDTKNLKTLRNYMIDCFFTSFININVNCRLNELSDKGKLTDKNEDKLMKKIYDKIYNDFILEFYPVYSPDEYNECELYGTGYLFGFEFARKYRLDPEKMKYNFYKFIKNIGHENDFNIYNKYGFNEEELKRNKALIKELKKR